MAEDFFSTFSPQLIESSNFDEELNKEQNSGKIVCVFMWGHDCPNCDIAKRVLTDQKESLNQLSLRWYHANIYNDFALATRFGLFGIPVFLFFKDGKKLGKISPFPGFAPFFEAVSKLS